MIELYKERKEYRIYFGDSREMGKVISEASIDCIVTDPPYELGFMDRKWDGTGVAFDKSFWAECLKVLKPEGYLLAFGGSRTFHRIACAIEDAGFEIRDTLMWLYSHGFPKSHDLGNGWGTALKPAYEPIIMARKPVNGSTEQNMLKYGVGGLNIDGCRVALEGVYEQKTMQRKVGGANPNGRFPSNVITDGSPKSTFAMPLGKNGQPVARYFYCAKADRKDRDEGLEDVDPHFGGTYNFRENGSLDGIVTKRHNPHPTVKPTELMQYLVRLVAPKGATILDPFCGSGSTGKAAMFENRERKSDYKFVGIELTSEYLPVIVKRIDWAIDANADYAFNDTSKDSDDAKEDSLWG